MKNVEILKKINYMLESDCEVMKTNLIKLKQDLEFEIMQEKNSFIKRSLTTVAKSCLDILKECKNKPILQKAIIKNDRLELTDSYRLVIFKNKDYVSIPTHNEEDARRYPDLTLVERSSKLNDLEINLDVCDIRNKYKIFKTLTSKEKIESEAYELYPGIYVNIKYLNNILDIFSCEDEIKVKISSSSSIKPISFESENIYALIVPMNKH